MKQLRRGLYETLITRELREQLTLLDQRLRRYEHAVPAAEAPDRYALHLARVIRRALETVEPKKVTAKAVALATAVVELLASGVEDSSLLLETPVDPGAILKGILEPRPDGSDAPLSTPLTPLIDTTLLTNAPGEPRIGRQLEDEIASADAIDVVMAFIRLSGIRDFLEPLRQHCEAGKSVRVLTTTFTGTTELAALLRLREVGAQIRVSFDTTRTRLHAKTWIFHRESGFSTAFVGSSNATQAGLVTGLEWNVRVSGARNPDVISKATAVFESYWNNQEFEPFDEGVFASRAGETRSATQLLLSPLEIHLLPFQERLLEQVNIARQAGEHRNLLVSATGTGKTVMAAVDYARLRTQLPRARLLFVAHRDEILQQSQLTYAQALREPDFGERWIGGNRPISFNHVFASIQSLAKADLADLAPDHFDIVVIDEFHHAAARTYRRLLEWLRPRELLGLTATPERSDGVPVLEWFNHRIAAELRLWDAIDQQRLVPFRYFGLHDGVDLRNVRWRRGVGYDSAALSGVLTGNDVWVRVVAKQLQRYVDDLGRIKALGFCVDVAHAQFMASAFSAIGIPSVAVSANSSVSERADALSALKEGRVNVVFSVDLFNEGVDVPQVDTLLLLRPTQSPVLFIQQLGRGLRRWERKSSCTVLDFVALHNAEFRFDRTLGGLLLASRKQLREQVEQGFPYLPAGCHMQLDRKASKIVLDSLKSALPRTTLAMAEELRRCAAGGDISLKRFLTESGLSLQDIYSAKRSWSAVREAAELPVLAPGPLEEELRQACGRLLHVDDLERLNAYRELAASAQPPEVELLTERSRRLARMFVASLLPKREAKELDLERALSVLWQHPAVLRELCNLFEVLVDRVEHLHAPLPTHANVPLQVHARYTRIEMLAALGQGKAAGTPEWREGVKWAKSESADVFAFTLDKTSGQFSPTTRYRDYAISPELIHWESQSTTSANSDTGRRYRNHLAMSSHILLFARLSTEDRAFWFLGPATYLSHQSQNPMQVTWRLAHALPGDLFAKFAAAVA